MISRIQNPYYFIWGEKGFLRPILQTSSASLSIPCIDWKPSTTEKLNHWRSGITQPHHLHAWSRLSSLKYIVNGVGIIRKRTSCLALYFTGFEKNFDSYGPDRVDSAEEPYDFDSLMHYDNQAFSKNGENTLQAISDPDRRLGNMDDFSAIDIKQLLKHYPCKAWDRKPVDNAGQRKAEEST